jgi:glycosyltransferase involved in cell wall biosynthesis
VGYLSRLTPDKGLDVLVDAFATVCAERPGRAHLAVAGAWSKVSDAFWKDLQGRARAGGFLEQMQYVGSPDLAGKVEFLKGASVFVLPTRIAERRAMACLEAMAAGVPIIVPRRGSLPEIVERTGGGMVVEPDDPPAIARAVQSLMDCPDEADRLGRAAQAGVREHFSAQEMADRTLQIYHWLCGTQVFPPSQLKGSEL